MVIVKGLVLTAEGPIPVEKLEVGMLVIDRGHRARKLTKIEKVHLHQTLHFERNKKSRRGRQQCAFYDHGNEKHHHVKEREEGQGGANSDAP